MFKAEINFGVDGALPVRKSPGPPTFGAPPYQPQPGNKWTFVKPIERILYEFWKDHNPFGGW